MELKTKKTKASVVNFLAGIEDPNRREDCQKLLQIFKKAIKEKAAMWGESIVGFGFYHYKLERSSQEGDWPLTGFAPRKKNISIYIMPGFRNYQSLLQKLGKHKVSSGSCLYIQRLSDINLSVLKRLIQSSVKDMKKMYKVHS